MPIGQKEVTPEEAINIANRVGLNSVNWNGSMLSLVLMDGTALEVETILFGLGGDHIETFFTYRTLRINRTPTEKY